MGFIFILAIGGVGFYLWLKSARGNQDRWRDAADRLGLGYFPGDMGGLGRIAGRKGGHRIEITTFTRSHGKSNSTYTKYKINFHVPIPADFKIVRQNALHKMGAFLGLKDVEVGDPTFDDRALVRGKNPDQIIEFLNAERRHAILRLLNSYVDIELTHMHIELTKSGRDTAPAILFNTTRQLLSVANELTDTSHSIAEEGHVIEINEAPSASSILNPIEKESVELKKDPYFPENPFAPEAPGAAFIEEWGEIAPEIIDEIEESSAEELPIIEPLEPPLNPLVSSNPVVPDPPLIEVDESLPNKTEDPVKDTEASALPVETEPAPDEPSELQRIAEDLYAGDSGSTLVATTIFKDHYENRLVIGKCLLKRVSKFSYDPVFKDMKGVKGTFELCELAGTYSKIKVKVEVAFPEDSYDELKRDVGSLIPVHGTLIAQDSMMHHLYIFSN